MCLGMSTLKIKKNVRLGLIWDMNLNFKGETPLHTAVGDRAQEIKEYLKVGEEKIKFGVGSLNHGFVDPENFNGPFNKEHDSEILRTCDFIFLCVPSTEGVEAVLRHLETARVKSSTPIYIIATKDWYSRGFKKSHMARPGSKQKKNKFSCVSFYGDKDSPIKKTLVEYFADLICEVIENEVQILKEEANARLHFK